MHGRYFSGMLGVSQSALKMFLNQSKSQYRVRPFCKCYPRRMQTEQIVVLLIAERDRLSRAIDALSMPLCFFFEARCTSMAAPLGRACHRR
jgi:hypothetical protein